ncbi:MAG: hypothetical protein ACPG6T_09200, partial [Paracoccaceae bacterium]
MAAKPPEPVQVIKQRRDAALAALLASIPYIQFLGIEFDRRGDELTAVMPYHEKLVGNPMLPALHGGAAGRLDPSRTALLDCCCGSGTVLAAAAALGVR